MAHHVSTQREELAQLASVHATIHGRVQGVSFRVFVWEHATRLRLTGYVRNLSQGATVEVLAEGPRASLEELLRALEAGPPRSRVERVDRAWSPYQGRFRRFEIH